MEYLQKSLSIKEPNGDKADIATSLGNIANVYLALRDYPKALEHYQRALSLDEEAGNRLLVADGNDRSEVFIGSEAREDRLKAEAGKFAVLHLATHGFIDDSNPMYSHLVLSQAQGTSNDDGLLEAWEMMNLELKADLVVLSACETARGRVANGEGVIGMSWALFVAGCPTAVVSEWKVDSASTTQLMLEFHNHLRTPLHLENHRMEVAKSLREAALKMLHSTEHRHPFYWAGFVVIGAGLK